MIHWQKRCLKDLKARKNLKIPHKAFSLCPPFLANVLVDMVLAPF
jgi:hypothetical protein